MKRTRIIAALLSVIVIIILALVLLPQEKRIKTGGNGLKRNVVVATMDIPAYTVLNEDMLEVIEYPEELVLAGSFENVEDLIGSTALVDMVMQEVVMKNHVAFNDETTQHLALNLEPGRRAMSVAVDDVSGVSNLLKVGDHVDIIVATDDITANVVNPDSPVGLMLLQNIKVVALEQTMFNAPVDDSNRYYYQTVTLSLLPNETVKLACAMKDSSVYLALRPENDIENVYVVPVQLGA